MFFVCLSDIILGKDRKKPSVTKNLRTFLFVKALYPIVILIKFYLIFWKILHMQ
jgi:hypothetical protein